MNSKNVFIMLVFMTSTALFAAKVTVYNQTGRDLEVIPEWGSKRRASVTIPAGSIYPMDSSIFHKFDSISWREVGTGVHYSIAIPSPRIMSDGKLEIRTGGNALINFNQKGTYNKNEYETIDGRGNRSFYANKKING